MRVEIDRVRYVPKVDLFGREALSLLNEIYCRLWAEAYSDPTNESVRKFAAPLADKMRELNQILRFKE